MSSIRLDKDTELVIGGRTTFDNWASAYVTAINELSATSRSNLFEEVGIGCTAVNERIGKAVKQLL